MAFYFSPSKHHPLVPNQDSAINQSRRINRDATSTSGLSLTSGQWSSDLELDDNQEWVVFSPQFLSSHADEEQSQNNDNEDIRPAILTNINNTITLQEEEEEEIDEEDKASEGALTPLAFPTHNGSGMFLEASDLTDRVNAWRLSQSQLVLQEMRKLERKFFNNNNHSTAVDGESSEYYINSGIESYGLNGSRIDEDAIEQQQPSSTSQPSPEGAEKSSFWATLRNFIGINDEVLEVIFGERLITEEEEETITTTPSIIEEPESTYTHYNQALITGPINWESNMITSIFKELHIPLPPEISLLRYLGTQLLALTQPEYTFTHPPPQPPTTRMHQQTRPPMNRNNRSTLSNTYSFQTFSAHTDSIMDRTFPSNYWEDSAVSNNYWEQSSSVSSTPVW